ncbi:hypothetical protein MtrunA17_Chr6g0468171 [Medicago truncatula]|uniref:Transmembrane protein, putative n=1 Tax=Medicago truncatula TaxID=3880 RepID=A0A072U8S8_MEDTR|nr:transmembrane protein, putative [Medicago truncatula]RHN51403.1 hypothetical protein MtrunA17_Chr6g0468171 [Medicago truncatula]
MATASFQSTTIFTYGEVITVTKTIIIIIYKQNHSYKLTFSGSNKNFTPIANCREPHLATVYVNFTAVFLTSRHRITTSHVSHCHRISQSQILTFVKPLNWVTSQQQKR